MKKKGEREREKETFDETSIIFFILVLSLIHYRHGCSVKREKEESLDHLADLSPAGKLL